MVMRSAPGVWPSASGGRERHDHHIGRGGHECRLSRTCVGKACKRGFKSAPSWVAAKDPFRMAVPVHQEGIAIESDKAKDITCLYITTCASERIANSDGICCVGSHPNSPSEFCYLGLEPGR